MATVYKLRDLETGTPYLVLPGVHTVGRHEHAEIRLAHESVSRSHAQIHNTEDGVLVEDLASSNGTFVYSQRIFVATPVALGAEITFGSMRFRLDPEVGASGAVEESVPPPAIDWEKIQRGTSKIAPRETPPGPAKAASGRVTTTESGHLVTVQSAAFPGGAMFPKATKSTKTTTAAISPPVPVVPRTGSGPLEKAGSGAFVVPPPQISVGGNKPIFVFLAGLGVGVIVGLVLARLLFFN